MAGGVARSRCTPLVATRRRPAYSRCLVLQPHRGDRTSVLGRARSVPCTDHRRPPVVDEITAQTPTLRRVHESANPLPARSLRIRHRFIMLRLASYLSRSRSAPLQTVRIGTRASFKHAHGRVTQSPGRAFPRRARLPRRRRLSKRFDERAGGCIHAGNGCFGASAEFRPHRFRERARRQRTHSR